MRTLTHRAQRLSVRVRRNPNGVYWACVVGIVAWAFARASGVDRAAPPIQLEPFLGVLTLVMVNLAVRNWASARRDQQGIAARVYYSLGWLFVSVDLICIALGLRFSGGLQSAIWVVAFVVLAGETLLENRVEATITRSGACLALFLGTVPSPSSTPDWAAYALEMVVRMGLLLAVSSVVRRLRERSEQVSAELANLKSELELTEQRSSLSREVHDGVGNSLAAAVMRLELAARVREKADASDPTIVILKDEAQTLREAMQQVRDWTFFNRPWSTEVSLAAEAERLSRRTGLPIKTEGSDLLSGLPEQVRLSVLRVAQEGLINAAKHAIGATQASVTVTRDPKTLTLVVADDGPGFDVAELGSGIGLMSMRERAEGQGGELVIESAPGEGTRIRLRLPLK
ncbi:sensor histidine kinase [Armatimonas rosea]|uniref:Oxygen sensor histidine kinase NreB n=1 Tax=Armatimonas rosea TaxID=685828 RepID=A0A7W9SV33_ARMRO|nr:sensor histidine kinase [Armatimonas rosea]MBB6053377.1 signal transduction histidine kinase [Armatimonas rosea]